MKPYNLRAHARQAPGLLRNMAGLLIWSASFLALYVGHAQGCQLLSPAMSGWLRTGLIVLWLLPLFVLGIMLVTSARRLRHIQRLRGSDGASPSTFMALLTLLLDTSSMLAVLATGVPILFVPVCTGMM